MLNNESFTNFIYWYMSKISYDSDEQFASLQAEYEGTIDEIEFVGDLKSHEDDDFLIVQSNLATEDGWTLYNELFIWLEDNIMNSPSIVWILKYGAREDLIRHIKGWDDLQPTEIITKVAEIQKNDLKRKFWILYRGAGDVKLTRVYEITH